MLIMGGHSSGGGLAIRFAGSQYGQKANAYLLMSPFLKYNAPTTRLNSVDLRSLTPAASLGLSC